MKREYIIRVVDTNQHQLYSYVRHFLPRENVPQYAKAVAKLSHFLSNEERIVIYEYVRSGCFL